MECVDLVSLVEQYDFVALDSSFFEGDGELRRTAYISYSSIELEALSERLKRATYDWHWITKNLLPLPQVFTVPGVIKELKYLKRKLKKAHRHCSKYCSGSRSSFRAFSQRNSHSELQAKNLILPKPTTGLNFLWRYALEVEQTVKKARVYAPKETEFGAYFAPQKGIPVVDYELMGAAVDYLQKNQWARASVFTRDRHFIQILDDYLDQNPTLPAGEIAAYFFHKHQVKNGSLLLREGLVSEAAEKSSPLEKVVNL